jgi:hypothetical protein
VSDRELAHNILYGVSLVATCSALLWLLGFLVGVFH